MKHARFFAVFVLAVAAIYGLVGFYFLPLANFEGNLTRMGMMPESLFGWTKVQPSIDPGLLKQASWQDADVLAIGDSFSMPLLWQTALTRRGLKVRTETWESMRDICEDFTDWLHDKGFKGRYVVMEVVEYNVETRLNRSVSCKHMSYHDVPELRPEPPAAQPSYPAKLAGRLSVGIRTRLHIMEYDRARARPGFAGLALTNEARLDRVPDGCQFFSHSSCNDALFFAGDHVPDFGAEVLERMQQVSARVKGFTPVWVIVPDKSTAYLRFNKKFWDNAENRLNAPNLLRAFREAIGERIVDLYFANDTHLSPAGYLVMGEAIYKGMRR